MLSMAAHWLERAEQADRVDKQQQQVRPEKQPEGECS